MEYTLLYVYAYKCLAKSFMTYFLKQNFDRYISSAPSLLEFWSDNRTADIALAPRRKKIITWKDAVW